MKKIFILLLMVMITLSGCSFPFAGQENSQPAISSNEQASFQYTETLTVNDVTTVLQAAGLPLIANQTINPADFLIDDITPVVYSIKPSDHILLLYDYKTIARRKDAEWIGDFYNFGLRDIPQKDTWFSRSFIAKNFVIIDIIDMEKFQQNFSAYTQFIKNLQKALVKLNNVQKMVFADQGSYFDARLNLEYYQHWYKNDQDQTGVDQYSSKKWQVKYLGSDPESIQNIHYEYSDSYGSGGSGDDSMQKIGDDYYLRLGSSSGNSAPARDNVYTLTIKWNGHQETLHLKAIPQFFPIPAKEYFDANSLNYSELHKYMTPPYSSF